MRLTLLPALVAAFFMGMYAMDNTRTANTAQRPATTRALQAGETFIAYRDAVMTFMQNNPAYTGSVTAAQLLAQGNSFSASFLALAGNSITATGVGGRVLTAYATLPAGSLAAAGTSSTFDASFGQAAGSNWLSIAPGATSQPLASAVPNGSIVSVIQIGK